MKRHILVCLIGCIVALASSIAAFAQPETTVRTTSLWKISSPKSSVYLLGSIHLLTADDYPLDSRLEEAFQGADLVVFETDLDSVQSPAIQQLMLSNAMYKDGKTLKSELSDSVYAVARGRFEAMGLDIEQLGSVKPWFAALTIAVTELQRLGFDFKRGVDMHFFTEARSQNKPVEMLETPFYQANLFVSLSDAEQEEFLIQTLEQMNDIEQYMKDIIGAWKEGDCQKLDHTLNKSFDNYPDLYRKFLVQRNENWLLHIERYLSGDLTPLIIVGEAHLCGDDGLLELLARKGYTIEQM